MKLEPSLQYDWKNQIDHIATHKQRTASLQAEHLTPFPMLHASIAPES